jgi:S-adenosylmethionine:tRNA-ribosyltransferase-isomerase (queuine synthetase)
MGRLTQPQKTKVFRVKTNFDKGIAFEEQCKNEETNVNAKLNSLINNSLLGQKKYFYSGKNKIKYNRAFNTFDWLVQLDSDKEIEILKNLSDDFIKSLKQEIEKALQERNDWIHSKKEGSVEIPGALIGGGR